MDSLLKRLGQRTAQRSQAANTPQPATKSPPRQSASAAARPEDGTFDLARDVRNVAGKQRGQAGQGVVHYISLSKMRDKLGADWEKSLARIDGIARQEIERRLAPTDVFKCMDHLNYLVLFTQLTRPQAELKCALIVEDIAKRVFGVDVDTSALEVKTAVVQPDGAVALEEMPSVADLAAGLFKAQDSGADTDEESVSLTDDPEGEALLADVRSLADIRLVYRPMWDVRQNTLATFICVPAVTSFDDSLITGEAAVPGCEQPDMAFELDRLVLQRIIRDLRALQTAGRKLLLVAPVHFETIASRHRREMYARWCESIPVASRKLLIFELVGVPESIPPSRLFELVILFRNFSRAVILRTPITRNQVQSPTDTGIFAVGVDLSGNHKGEAELMRDMDRLTTATARAGLRSYVHGLGSVSLTTAAVGAGFDYIDGDVITAVIDKPSAAYRFEARNIYVNPFRRDKSLPLGV